MKGPGHISIMALVILLGCQAVSGQKLKYDVFLFGKKIGETIVEMRDSADVKLYSFHNISRVKFLFWDKKFNLSGRVVVGRDGLMTVSTFENIKENGCSVTRSVWDKNKLLVYKNGEKWTLNDAVKFPSILLYFFEPHDLQKFFYEPKGAYFEIKKEAEGLYSGQVSNHSDKYTYDKGRLIQVEFKNTFGSILMKLVN
jgi:hypothetical protein